MDTIEKTVSGVVVAVEVVVVVEVIAAAAVEAAVAVTTSKTVSVTTINKLQKNRKWKILSRM